MNETEFDRAATDTIARIEETLERAIDETGADIDYETVGGILTLEFADGSRIIVNKQGAARQIWVAARSGGFHYSFKDGRWRNDQNGNELFADLSRLVGSQSGVAVDLG